MVAALSRLARAGPAQPTTAWRVWASFLLALCGLGVSTYLTVVHFAGNQLLVCSANSVVNCEAVITSPQSYVLGIPVAVLGLAFYVVMVAACSPWAWRAADRRIHLGRLALAALGMAFVLYLIATELLVIKAICLWCTAVHILTFAQLILVVATVPTMLGWSGHQEISTRNDARNKRARRLSASAPPSARRRAASGAARRR